MSSTNCIRISPRLEREIITMKNSPPPGISCCPSDDSKKNVLSASIVGTKGSPYEKGVFQLEVIVTARYPFEPPHVRFITPLYHPNVDAAGRICLDLLKMPPHGGWKPTFTVESLLIAIQYLLANPNPDDPLMPDIASQYKYNKDQFDKDAEEWTIKHACLNAVTTCISNDQSHLEETSTNNLELNGDHTEPLNVSTKKSGDGRKKRKSDVDFEENSDPNKRQKEN